MYVIFTYTKCLIVFIRFIFGNFWKIKIWLFGKRWLYWLQIYMWWGLVIMHLGSLLLVIKYIKNRVINCVMVVLIKCINNNIYRHNAQLQCFKAFMEYAIEPVEICLHKACYMTRFLRIEEGVRITCYTCNV